MNHTLCGAPESWSTKVTVVPEATVSDEGEKFSPVLAPCGMVTVAPTLVVDELVDWDVEVLVLEVAVVLVDVEFVVLLVREEVELLIVGGTVEEVEDVLVVLGVLGVEVARYTPTPIMMINTMTMAAPMVVDMPLSFRSNFIFSSLHLGA